MATAPPGTAERLVVVATDLLDREGIEAVTLRRIAREAGVSHGAPLRHYPTLAVLLSEVAARGFRMLSDAVGAAAGAVPAGEGARARLVAACRAYLATALEHPGLFTLMFRPDQLDFEVPSLVEESFGSFEGLVGLVRAAQDAGWRPEAETRVLAGTAWAAIHGLATLWSQGAMQGVTGNPSLETATSTMIDMVLGDLHERSTA